MKTNAVNTSTLPSSTEVNPQQKRVFKFLDYYGDKMGTKRKYIYYRPPELKTEGEKWYVEYYYRVPPELRHRYEKDWERFKVYEDINRFKDEEFNQTLIKAVELALEDGFNPFEEELKELTEQKKEIQEKKKELTAQQAILFWEKQWKDRGLEEKSLKKYYRTSQRFLAWLIDLKQHQAPANEVTETMIETYLKKKKAEANWSNRTYNNERDIIKMIFGYLQKKSKIAVNPTIDIHKQKTASKKHRAYDARRLETLIGAMKENDPYLYFAFQVVYYLCIRSEKELRLFKVGNILPDRKQVFLPADDTKTDSDAYVPMCDEILRVFQERGVLDYPPGHYVFSAPHKHKFILDGTPGADMIGDGFFSRRFRRLREAIGLAKEYTLYGAKHTRVIHLKQDGVKDHDIMALTRHRDYASYATYLRDIGIDADVEAISKNTRKI